MSSVKNKRVLGLVGFLKHRLNQKKGLATKTKPVANSRALFFCRVRFNDLRFVFHDSS